MPSYLHRLVYYSRNRIPPAELLANIEAILKTSQRNNARVNVTGALIFNKGIFAQVLEGALVDIEATFERIQQDVRHGDVQVLFIEPTGSRVFPSWSMGFIGRSSVGENLFGRIGEASGFEVARLHGDRVLEVMQRIAIEEETPAA